MKPILRTFLLIATASALLAHARPEGRAYTIPPAGRAHGTAAQAPEFFPVAVWYGGGKARAPMIERDARSKKEAWRKDIQQIKALGFNTVRAWIDWASGQPSEDKFDFETL